MTRYDPFAYGEVSLDQQRAAADGPPDAEDLLFAGGEEVKHAPPADESWSMLQEEPLDELLPGSALASTTVFGQEILGEATATPEFVGDEVLAPEKKHATRRPVERREVARRPLAPPREEAAPAAKPAQTRQEVMPRRRPIAGVVVPLLLCAGGGSAASWFMVMQQNVVMAGIIGAATLVSALFAWLFLRG